MDKFQDILMKVGVFAAENRYLSSIKNAFQTFVPFTIIGAIGVLWSNVISTSISFISRPCFAIFSKQTSKASLSF